MQRTNHAALSDRTDGTLTRLLPAQPEARRLSSAPSSLLASADISDTLPLSSNPATKLVTHSAATAFLDSGARARSAFVFSSCGSRSVSACTKFQPVTESRHLTLQGKKF
jgi:hypothetical protein